jgi:hypothetical protein
MTFLKMFVLAMLGLAAVTTASAQAPASEFPVAAIGFLNEELPRMETAVSEKDRDYFEAAMGRTLDFSEQWGFKTTANPSLAPYRMCTDAVSDFVIVGLCRLMPAGDVCEPGLAPRFADNLKRCREVAAKR